jgi:hypothetical protein
VSLEDGRMGGWEAQANSEAVPGPQWSPVVSGPGLRTFLRSGYP